MKFLLTLFRRWLLVRLLRPEQFELIRALEAPHRWMPDPKLTEKEAEAWGVALTTPLLLKIDQAMINLTQQHAQHALQATPAELERRAGFASGYRAGWEMAKTLSRLHVAEDVLTETPAPTADGSLEHLRP